MSGFICSGRTYRFRGHYFEMVMGGGPWPLGKHGDPRKSATDQFWRDMDRFFALPKEAQEKYRDGGGCQPIGGVND